MINILHLEASKLIRKWMEDLVESSGNIYYSASESEQAFNVLKNKSIDLIITAIEFQCDTGVGFIETLNNSDFSDIPIIVLTSIDTIENREKIYNLGVVDYLIKGKIEDEAILLYLKTYEEMKTQNQKISSVKIAVLDDSNLSITIIKKIFQLTNFPLVDYYSKSDDLIKSDKTYDIYILDLILPGLSGETLFLKLKERNPICSVITMSTVSNYKTISSILLSGADDYLMKPFDANIFLARLRLQVKYIQTLKQLEKKNEELLELSVTDPLTGLYNRRFVLEQLRNEIWRKKRHKKKLAVLLLDIDNFKSVNDNYGHTIGDLVLKEVAVRIKELVRKTDIVSRYGGEEFLIVLTEIDTPKLIQLSDRIRSAIEAVKFDIESLKITVSGGLCLIGEHCVDDAIAEADEKLYEAKNGGKNVIVY